MREKGLTGEITGGQLNVRHPDGVIYSHMLDGGWRSDKNSKYDLLLPAIDSAPEPEGFSEPTIWALKAYREFWENFQFNVRMGATDPTDGYTYVNGRGACVECTYPTREAALSEAAAVIAAVDALLEGGPAK